MRLLPLAFAGSLGLVSVASAGVTFDDVRPLLERHCQECHRPGQIAPMSFLTYEETRPWADSIQETVASRTMPPWHADSH
ncbi:MAG: thiol-disulfide isomerase, partial [Vicinamibacteria bacterium]